MDISLNPEMQRFVDAKVRAGRYASASDLVNDALAALKSETVLPIFTLRFAICNLQFAIPADQIANCKMQIAK
jgi:putative addiction module CopG family antidote